MARPLHGTVTCGLSAAATVVALLLTTPALAAERVARLVGQTGTVSVLRAGAGAATTLATNAELFAGDTLITGADGRASLVLDDESLVQINRSTRLVLKSVGQSAGWLPAAAQRAAGSLYELLSGELWFRNDGTEVDVAIETPQVAIGVRGTEFVVRVLPAAVTEVDMLEGRIQASNPFGSIDAISGEQVYAAAGSAPRKRLLLNPENAVQWTALVPALLDPATVAATAPAARQALSDLSAGDNSKARAQLEAALAANPADPALLTASAWLDLNDARAAEAARTMQSVTAAHPTAAYAWPVYALALLTTNQADAALDAIRTAQQLTPGNADYYLLESYIRQAQLDFDAAIAANEQALTLAPENLLALVNAARLQFGRGDLAASRALTQRAAAIDGSDVEVQNLSGFLALAANNSAAAEVAFQQALARDPAFAEAHLGLGLTQMRRGDTTGALQSLSTAVALDPTRAIYMSYWGRALYDLGRHPDALEVLQRAVQLDPRDPTPWYLQAIVLRDLNRFGEAIEHYNRAVELNDNRAVYRSQFLLDQDMAVRNIDLSLIFQEYRFNAWAANRAISAINDDFGNFGGHIMYAGALSEQLNRDTAFLSETLQARLLQPANRNSFNNFNQYTSFFDQPALEGSARTQQGSYDTQTYEGELFGALPEQNLAFQAGFLDARSDGWNGVNGDEVRDFSGIVKWDATLQGSFLFAYSNFDATLYDDLDRRFEYDDIPDPTYKTDSRLDRLEAGYRYNFAPGNDLLIYYAHIRLKSYNEFSALFDKSTDTVIDYDIGDQRQHNDRTASQMQLQWNRRFEAHELIVGTSNYTGDNNVRREEDYTNWLGTTDGSIPPTPQVIPQFEVRLANDANRSFSSVYVQDTWTVNDWLDLEGALYYDYLENSEPLVEDRWTEQKLNPRVGAIIQASERDTFKLAASRYIAPFFSAQLSPTELAGLAIFRNSQEGALIKNIEGAWQRDWNTGFYSVNAFWVKNETEGRSIFTIIELPGPLKFTDPFVTAFTGEAKTTGIEAELNQMLGRRFGIVGRYLYADVTDEWYPDSDRTENQLGVELTFIDPSGFSAGVRQVFRYLDMDNRTGNERIRYTDLDVEYQFPNRNVVLNVAARNIFNNHFNYVTDRFTLGGVIPERNALATFEVNF